MDIIDQYISQCNKDNIVRLSRAHMNESDNILLAVLSLAIIGLMYICNFIPGFSWISNTLVMGIIGMFAYKQYHQASEDKTHWVWKSVDKFIKLTTGGSFGVAEPNKED